MTKAKTKYIEGSPDLYDDIEDLQDDCELETGDKVYEVVARYEVKNETKLKKIDL